MKRIWLLLMCLLVSTSVHAESTQGSVSFRITIRPSLEARVQEEVRSAETVKRETVETVETEVKPDETSKEEKVVVRTTYYL